MWKRAAIVAVAVVAFLVSAAGVAHIVLPVGVWLVHVPGEGWIFARYFSRHLSTGFRSRTYWCCDDWTLRQSLDVNGDGQWDLEGLNWQGTAPVSCSQRVDSDWVPAPPELCEAEWMKAIAAPGP